MIDPRLGPRRADDDGAPSSPPPIGETVAGDGVVALGDNGSEICGGVSGPSAAARWAVALSEMMQTMAVDTTVRSRWVLMSVVGWESI